jgi:ATP-dependent RNA helicase DeaD
MLHRSGRTGRAGRKGTSVLIVPGKSSQKAERLLKMAKIEATWEKPPSADAVREKDHERLLSDPNWSIPVKESEQKFLTKLKSVYTAEQISLAYIRLYESRQSSPEELDDTPNVTRDSSRSKFGPTIWFSLALGRDKGADPRSLLPMRCNGGGITKDDIGAIRIQSNETFFELKKKCVERFVLSVGPSKKLEDRVQLRQLEKVPDFDQFPNSTRPHSKPRSSPRRTERKENYSKPNMNKRNNRGPSDNGASKRLNPIDRVPREGAVTPLKGERKSKPRNFSGKSERRESFAKPRQSNAHKSNNEDLSNSERPKRFEKNTKMSSEGTKVFSPKDKKYSAKSQSNKADSSTLKEARSKAKPRLESSVKPKSTRPFKSRSNANDTSKRFSPKGKPVKLKNKKPNERN